MRQWDFLLIQHVAEARWHTHRRRCGVFAGKVVNRCPGLRDEPVARERTEGGEATEERSNSRTS